jgi:hypothetical protein
MAPVVTDFPTVLRVDLKRAIRGASMDSNRDAQNGFEQGGQRQLEVIRAWFESLASELKADLAFLVSTVLPGLLADHAEPACDDAVSLLRRALTLQAPTDSLVVAGRAFALFAVIDFLFLHRSTREDWLLYEKSLEQFRDEALAAGEQAGASLVQSMIDQIPQRCALWISESPRWRSIRIANDQLLRPTAIRFHAALSPVQR